MDTTKRNYGVDLLKALSMFLVVVLHILGNGGILSSIVVGSPQFYVAWLLEVIAYCAVNCFALTTGFLMIGRNVKYRKIINLWLIVEFYNIVFFVIDVFILHNDITIGKIKTFAPVITNEFWYFTAYFCLFFFTPLLNKFVENVSKNTIYTLLVTGFMLFCLFNFFNLYDVFGLQNGYSVWWLMYLYLLGAAIKKYDLFDKLKISLALIGFFVTVLITLIIKTFAIQTSSFGVIGKAISLFGGRFVNYLSPTILASAIFLMVLCLKIKISKNFSKVLSIIAPPTLIFQVYIIHQHYFVVDNLFRNKFVKYASMNWLVLILLTIGTAILIFASCIIIDWLRNLIFKLLKFDKTVNKISDKITDKLNNSRIKQKFIAFLENKIGI